MKAFTLGLLALLAVGTGLLASSAAQAAGKVITSTATLPFSGSFFDEGTTQNINLSGAVSVVSQMTFLPAATSLSIHAILPAVFGIGTETGCKYLLYGADQVKLQLPPNPVTNAAPVVGFMIPPNPIVPNNPLCPEPKGAIVYLKLFLTFAPDGSLFFPPCQDCLPPVKVCGENPACP